MGQYLVFCLAAAANPTLVAATTVLLLLPDPKKLMLGYLLGAYLVSITLGVVIVFAFRDAGVVGTAKNVIGPGADLALGGVLLAVALVLAGGRGERLLEKRRTRSRSGKPPRWQRALGRGSARVTFAVGVVLTLPGASYLAALQHLSRLDYAPAPTVLLVILANLIMLALIELPLLGFLFAPDWTPRAVEKAKDWTGRHLRDLVVGGAGTVGALLVLRGALQLLA